MLAKSFCLAAILTAGTLLAEAPWLDASGFSAKGSYKKLGSIKGVSGSLPEGWSDNSSWSGSTVKYSFVEDQGSGFLRAECKGEGMCQLQLPIDKKLDKLSCFELSVRARSKSSSAIIVSLKEREGSHAAFVKKRLELSESWQDFQVPVSGGPSAGSLCLSIEMFSPSSADIAYVRFASVPSEKYVPVSARAEPRDDEAWDARFRSLVKGMAASKPDFVIMGDSITQRWEQAGADAWKKQIAPFKSANFGVDGDCTQHLLWRIRNSGIGKDFSPKLVAILIGVNNFGDEQPIHEIAAGTSLCVKEIQKLSPGTKILLLGVFPMGKDDNEDRQALKDLNKLYAAMADSKTVFYADIGPIFLEKDGSISQKTMPDYLHLSAPAYAKYASALAPEIKKLLAAK